jgi:hypothetical protein
MSEKEKQDSNSAGKLKNILSNASSALNSDIWYSLKQCCGSGSGGSVTIGILDPVRIQIRKKYLRIRNTCLKFIYVYLLVVAKFMDLVHINSIFTINFDF